MKDRIPPQAIDAEIAVLGTCLVYPEAVNQVYSLLRPEMFYSQAHQRIFQEIISLHKKNYPTDLISVTDRLREDNLLDSVGGEIAVTKLMEQVVSDSLVSNHAHIVLDKFMSREYIRFAQELAEKALTEDIADVIEFAESSIFKLSNFDQNKDPVHVSVPIDDVLETIRKIQYKEIEMGGVPSGIESIDNITGGWKGGNLIIIAGCTSMGKTAIALQFAKNSAKHGCPVVIFSLEMSRNELVTRYLSGVSGYSNMNISTARVNLGKLTGESKEVAPLPIYIDDSSPVSIFELRSKVKKLIVRHRVGIIIIDYLQLMHGEGKTREQEISSISRGLKIISKEFNIPVIALSQLKRGLEERSDKRPRLSDLRESGAIEQDADLVAFVSRPAIYGEKYIEIDNREVSTQNLMLFDIAKHRNGACFALGLHHNEHLSVITERDQKSI